MNPDILDALRYCPNLPSPPKIALRILELSRDPNIDLDPLAHLLAKDPALASRVLRASNSALFGQPRRSENLRQAMVTIGLNATITLSLSFSLAGSFKGEAAVSQGYHRVWQRALIAASASRLLGEHMGLRYIEELFLASLLQDIGILALNAALPETYRPLMAQPWQHDTLLDSEQAALGADHGEAGSWLMHHWGLPARLALVPAAVHQPHSEDIPEKSRVFVNVVAVAGQIADLFLSDPIPPKTDQAATNKQLLAFSRKTEQVVVNAEQLLAFPRIELNPLLEQVAELLPEVTALYDTEIISASIAAGVIDQAREMLTTHNLRLICQIAEQQSKMQTLQQATQPLRDSSERDTLTGLYNRRYFDDRLYSEFTRANASGWPLTVGFIDIDHFKSINDTRGHLVGDALLASVAQIVTQHLRQCDLITRYGDNEFVALLLGTGLQQAQTILERLREAIATPPYQGRSGENVYLTVSIGLASHRDQGQHFSSAVDLICAADRALHEAKSLGGNRLVINTNRLD